MTTVKPDLQSYNAQDARLASLLNANLPDVSGAITKTYQFKLRAVFPWDRYTESLLFAYTGSAEQLEFLRGLEQSIKLTSETHPLTVVHLDVSEQSSRLFKTPGQEPGMTALLSLTLSYSAHRTYRNAELQASMKLCLNHPRYPDSSLQLMLLPNR